MSCPDHGVICSGALCGRNSRIDFNRFFEQVFVFILCERLFLAWDVATNEVFAARVFKAFSATARLKVIGAILAWRGNEALIVRPDAGGEA